MNPADIEVGHEITVVSEDLVDTATRAEAFAIFPGRWQCMVGNGPLRGWTQQRPGWRVLVRDRSTGSLLAQAGLVDLCSNPPVLGISDVVTHQDHTGQGLAGQVLEEACVFADRLGVPVLVDTAHEGLRRHLGRLGFLPVTDQAVLCGPDGETVPAGWMCRGVLLGARLCSNF